MRWRDEIKKRGLRGAAPYELSERGPLAPALLHKGGLCLPKKEKNKKSRKKVLTNESWCGNINELSARGQRRKAKKWLNKAKNAILHHGRRKSLTLERIEKRLKKVLDKIWTT